MALWRDDDPYQQALKAEAAMMLARPRAVMFHDELSEVYAPQFLSDVVAHAGRHGLDYLCDLHPAQAAEDGLADLLDAAEGEASRLEQVQDFAIMRRFRQSVFRLAGGPPAAPRIPPARLEGLYAQAVLRRAPGLGQDGAHVFMTDKIETVETSDDRLAALLGDIGEAAPGALAVAGRIDETLGQAILQLFLKGVLHLQTGPFVLTLDPGAQPLASPLARLQIARGEPLLCALNHVNVRVEDPDGSRAGHGRAADADRSRPRATGGLGPAAGLTVLSRGLSLPTRDTRPSGCASRWLGRPHRSARGNRGAAGRI
jgi:hypothetical protein